MVKLLSLYSVTLNFVNPPELATPDWVKNEATQAGISWTETSNLDDVIGKTDVLYVTRVQKERFSSVAEYDAVKDSYVIDNEVMAKAKSTCIIMHPLPRVNELSEELDFDPRCCIFRQMRYGLFVSVVLFGWRSVCVGTG